MRYLMLVLVAGCGYHLYSPPVRGIPLEGPRTGGEGAVGVHGGGSINGIELAGGVGAASAGVSYGLGENVDLELDGTFAYVKGETRAEVRSDIYLGRVGVKVELSPYLSVGGGAGLAVSPSVGNAVAADVSAIVAYDNCYLVPFLSVGTFISAPFDANTVDLALQGDGQSHLATPHTTFGMPVSTGLRIPFEHDVCRAGGRSRSALTVGAGITPMITSESNDAMATLGVMIEIGL